MTAPHTIYKMDPQQFDAAIELLTKIHQSLTPVTDRAAVKCDVVPEAEETIKAASSKKKETLVNSEPIAT